MFTKEKVKTTDLRVQKTKKLIKDAFFELVEEKGYSKVTVMEIANKAMINRNTFYLHYVDKEDLIDQILTDNLKAHQEFIDTIIHGSILEEESPYDNLLETFKETCVLVKEEIDLYRIIVLDPGLSGYLIKLKNYIKKQINVYQNESLETKLRFDYMFEGMFGLIIQWIKTQNVSCDDMAKYMVMIIKDDYTKLKTKVSTF